MSDNSQRAIIHLDLDAFFCSVEVLKNPKLSGKPIVVGGQPEQRGVVAAASYPARKFGIHSAMPMSRAKRLCKELIILPHNFKSYKTYSMIVMKILEQEADLVEQISVDEAFLDVTSRIAVWDEAVDIAKNLQNKLSVNIGLSSSIGVATNKMIAKIASDFDKPNGLTVVLPGEEKSFLAQLKPQKISGIGPKMAEKLAEMNVNTIRDLAKIPHNILETKFGKIGTAMAQWAQGIDNRPVQVSREIKSISNERTFPKDISSKNELIMILTQLCEKVASRLKDKKFKAKRVFIKLRYYDFDTHTTQKSLSEPTDSEDIITDIAKELFFYAWADKKPIRLLGVGVSNFNNEGTGQVALF
ncbi:MAG: DNA polymerase IV [Planctomycetia bacterium]|nr:DNA polymerase IV [Planctomycetia bacterium]